MCRLDTCTFNLCKFWPIIKKNATVTKLANHQFDIDTVFCYALMVSIQHNEKTSRVDIKQP